MFDYFLHAQKFKQYTDHLTLTFIFSQGQLNPMLTQWAGHLLSYDFEILHLPGLLNVLPDALSRLFDSPEPSAPKDQVLLQLALTVAPSMTEAEQLEMIAKLVILAFSTPSRS